jgi:ferredoxin-NADP reductase
MKKYSVLNITHKTQNTFCLRLERPKVPIKSGQCFNLGVVGTNVNREYSMYSGADEPFLEFLIRAVDGGLVSTLLQNLKIGDEVEIDGPYGQFCITPEVLNSKIVFIGSGTGVAPFHSFVKTYPSLDFVLIHGIRYIDECYDYGDYEQGRYIPCISRNEGGRSLRVTDYLRENPISPNAFVYLCGNRNMIIDSVQILLDQGVGGDRIISEVFF